MPGLNYIQTNNDPSVAEALQYVSSVIKNSTATALRNQLSQLQVQQAQIGLQTSLLQNQRAQQLYDQSELSFPLDMQEKGLDIQGKITNQQFQPQILQQGLRRGEQQYQQSEKMFPEELSLQKSQATQAGRVTEAQPLDIQNRQEFEKQKAATAKLDTKIGKINYQQTKEEFDKRKDNRAFNSAITKALLEIALPTDAAAPVKEAFNFYAPLVTDQFLGKMSVLTNQMMNHAEHTEELKAQQEHYKAMQGQVDARTKSQYILAALRSKNPSVLANAKAMYPEDALLQSLPGGVGNESDDIKTRQEAEVWGLQQSDPAIRDGAMEYGRWRNTPPEKVSKDIYGQEIKVPDMEAFEAAKARIRKFTAALAERRDQVQTGKGQPAGQPAGQAQAAAPAATPAGEGTRENPIQLTKKGPEGVKEALQYKGKIIRTVDGQILEVK